MMLLRGRRRLRVKYVSLSVMAEEKRGRGVNCLAERC
jgi:hypothetical protein